ncbi:MAG: molybdopterin-synthase adenylyltransferase MoeB [Lachnospiraceae bacterium]|nr:molybdopterin-synthase adenylyltransferase MoeB [Lachnospiraceae bacterium]MDE6252144.1 molybdopterin-synthase adenylyltransferase MoeB [Lachnospiraceae bacterium]
MDITLRQIEEMINDDFVFVDIRSKVAYEHGHITSALHWNGKDDTIWLLPQNKILIVYCSYGEQSISATKKLRQNGYHAYNLSGGYREWLLHNMEELSEEEIRRYDRQIILPQVGSEGQKKLKKAHILIIGVGGLGAPAALYLAAAGVGTIGIMDADIVNISNLQRQIIHSIETENINKAESAKKMMLKLNNDIIVKTYPYFLDADNAEEIIEEYDFVIDAVDNFETKFLINDVCVLHNKPFCHAGILQFEGQVMTYVPGENPCYRCIFEEIPERGTIPNCSQAGIIGAVAGMVGSIQALEAIKYILDIGELLTGKMFIVDGLSMRTRIAKFEKINYNCKVCGDRRTIRNIKDNASEYSMGLCRR